MSVITEIRKTKQKWSLNPRGKAWSEDSNKFGQKMLEKMGWSRGKGLGAKENGVTEHIRLSYKNDTKGMGFKESDGQWTEHDVHYNALLQSLSGSQETAENEIKISSLEKQSQSSKVRVHYKKFTRGKDLSRCSEKDLAQIFGKKTLKAALAPIEEETKAPEISFAYNAGSMVDYFKKKLPNFGKISSPQVESEEENCVGFGFKTPEKKRKLSEDSVEGTPKKFKNGDEDQIGLSNPAFDPFFNGVGVQKHVLNTIQEEDCEIFEDPGKRKTEEEAFGDGKNKKKNRSIEALTDFEEGRKKRKKIKGNTAVENPTFEEGDLKNGCINNFEIKRKKKKSKDNIDNDSQRSDDFEVRRKKKEENSMALDNPNFNAEIIENGFVDENFEVKRRNKKKKVEMAIDNPNFNDENTDESTFNNDFEVKRKKKEKKKDSLAIDNPNFNDFHDSQTEDEKTKKSVHNEPEFDLMLNVTSTPCIKEEKSSSLKKVKRRKSVRFSDINEERIIPNEDIQLRNELFDINTKVISNGLKESGDGTSNLGFDKSQVILNENIDELSRRIDSFQAEIENDMNEAKSKNQFGEKLSNGTKLKFRDVQFGKTPPWARSGTIPTAKKSYKHLIKGDIILAFNNTNLHEITGYGVNVEK